jgi:single-strand DNA-binding protein
VPLTAGRNDMAGRPKLEKHTVTGNLTADPVTRKVGESELVTFRLADTPRIFDREAKAWKDGETVYYDVAVRNAKLGGNVQGSLHKGNRATVAGNYEAVANITKDQKPVLNHRIWAEDVSASLEFATVVIEPNPKGLWSDEMDAQAATVNVEQTAIDREWGLD